MENKFGKVRFISQNEFSQGYLLRETSRGVVLEKHYDSGHNNVDVVAEFEGATLQNEFNRDVCIAESRKYVGDAKTPIYVDLNPWNAKINQ